MIAALLLAAALAAPAPAPARADQCIQISPGNQAQYIGVDDHTIVVRGLGRAWKLTTTRSSLITDPTASFINVVRGPSLLCKPIDFQLSVASRPIGAFQTPLIVQDFHPITVAEADALTGRNRRR
jgi:hypothetical protein